MPKTDGFTLVEILVAVSIIGILSLAAYASISASTGSRTLAKAVDEVKVLLRQAQSNASSVVFCQDKPGLFWLVEFSKATPDKITLSCIDVDRDDQTIQQRQFVKELSLKNATVSYIQGNCADNTFPTNDVTIKLPSLRGEILFESSSALDSCFNQSNNITIGIKTQNISQEVEGKILVNKKGAIDVE